MTLVDTSALYAVLDRDDENHPVAKADARPGSDVDVLVVLDAVDSYSGEIERTSQRRAEIALRHDVSISLVYVSEDAWIRGEMPVMQNARREGRAA